MFPDLTAQAIKAALENNWQAAVKVNLAILDADQENIEALNRLAHAYKEIGNFKLAQKTYRQVLSLDRFNPIAQKNLKLLEALPKSFKIKTCRFNHCQTQFLEEPGKTKVVNLVNLAPSSVILRLSCGMPVKLVIKRRAVMVTDEEGTYLAALPDDLSAKLIKFIKAGNQYEAFIKTVAKNNISVFVREISRVLRFKNQPTFSVVTGSYRSPSQQEDASNEEEAEAETPEEEVI